MYLNKKIAKMMKIREERKRHEKNTNVKILSFVNIEVDVREGKGLRKR